MKGVHVTKAHTQTLGQVVAVVGSNVANHRQQLAHIDSIHPELGLFPL